MPRGIDLDLSSGMKTCPKCLQNKTLGEFHKSKSTVTGYSVYCKRCSYERHNEWRKNNLEHCAAQQKKHRQANPKRHAAYARKVAYRMDVGAFERLLAEQDGKCAICRTTKPGKKGFHVDHCHEGGHIRGLLCHNCNVGIGHLQHSIAVLESAVMYISRTSPRMR